MEQPNLTIQLAALAHALGPSHPQAPALLRWAILHIESQDKALAETRQEWANEEHLQTVVRQLIAATELHHRNPLDLENQSAYNEAKRMAKQAIGLDT